MMHRRAVLAGAAALAALPRSSVFGQAASQLTFKGSREQGSLIVCQTVPAAMSATVDGEMVRTSPADCSFSALLTIAPQPSISKRISVKT